MLFALHCLCFWPVWRWYAQRLDDGSDEPWAIVALLAAALLTWPRQGFRLDPRDVLLRANEIQNESLWSTECADAGACLVGTDRVWTLSADNLETGRRAGATDQLTFAEQRALALFDQVSTVRVDGFTLAYFVRRPLVPVVEEPTSAYRHYGPGVAVPAGG